MALSTGVELHGRSRVVRNVVELISSMLSISLLIVICIASVIGTVVKRHEPVNNYINQFGRFWTDVFGAANLCAVYGAWRAALLRTL